MEVPIPECPVCLEPYDPTTVVPRVLTCGHSTCHVCLLRLSSPFPDAVRCPSCTQLVRLPRRLGPTSLPKNIDLLRFIPTPFPPSILPKTLPSPPSVPLVISDHRLFSRWKDRIVAYDNIEVDSVEDDVMTARFASGEVNRLVKLVPIAVCEDGSEEKELRLSYVVRAVEAVGRMGEIERRRLELLLESASEEARGVCRMYGLWIREGDCNVYLVCERFSRGNLGSVVVAEWKEEEVVEFGMIGVEMCEAVVRIHRRGLVCGCLEVECFCFDDYGHCLLDLSRVLMTGRRVWERIGSNEGGGYDEFGFVSPEMFVALQEKNVSFECCYASDVWCLACTFATMLLGYSNPLRCVEDSGYLSIDAYNLWMGKVISALESSFSITSFEPLVEIIKRALSYDPGSRPQVSDIWTCIRELLIKPKMDEIHIPAVKETPVCCLLLCGFDSATEQGCCVTGEQDKVSTKLKDDFDGHEAESKGTDSEQSSEETVDRVAAIGLHGGASKSSTLQGHRDCVTGLAVGGGMLFSSSYDKTVNAWSLQDFSHLRSFEGHEHKVMALVAVELSQMLCVSADSGGFLFVWDTESSTDQTPLRKWREHDDWRFSGIHSLAVLGSQYLYSGSGDKSIKAWSLQDYSLACTMTGHTSTVSSLVVANGILYSGSWDGTVRLWWLDDHSPLSVLGNDSPGNGFSVLSLSVDGNLLGASYENGHIKVWRNDAEVKCMQIENGAIFALHMDKNWLFTGGWDKTIKVQKFSDDEIQMELEHFGSISCDSIITSMLHWQGKLFVGQSNREIKVYYR